MNKKLIVNPELSERIPPLNSDEYQNLEKNLIEEGCRDALITWYNKEKEPELKYCETCNKEVNYVLSDGSYQCSECDASISLTEDTIIDGHTRYEICQRHNIEFKTEIHEFDNIEDVKDWIDANQLGRRNLTDDQRKILIGRRYNREKSKQGGDRKSKVQFEPLINTAEKLAVENKIGKSTVKRYGQLATEFEEMKIEKPELAKDLFDGKITFKEIKADEKLKNLGQKKAKNIEQGSADIPIKPEVSLMDYKDFLLSFDDDSIDLLFTDPPYSTDVADIKAFTECWLPLAIQKTKKSGRMLIFAGAYAKEMEAFLSVLSEQTKFTYDFPLVWCYKNTLAKTPKMHHKLNYQFIWELYSNESAPLDISVTGEMFSVMEINAPDARQGKRFHKWQKPDELAQRLIRHTTKDGDLVVDPFVCTGTFVLEANRLKRVGKGCDNNQANLDIAISRGCQLINHIDVPQATEDYVANSTVIFKADFPSMEENKTHESVEHNVKEKSDELLEIVGDVVEVNEYLGLYRIEESDGLILQPPKDEYTKPLSENIDFHKRTRRKTKDIFQK